MEQSLCILCHSVCLSVHDCMCMSVCLSIIIMSINKGLLTLDIKLLITSSGVNITFIKMCLTFGLWGILCLRYFTRLSYSPVVFSACVCLMIHVSHSGL